MPRFSRSPASTRSFPDNAAYCEALATAHGSAARLRVLGKDTFILTPDVLKGLRKAGVKNPSATSKAGLAAAQAASNAWHDESGLPLCAISRVLACSTG